MPDAIETKPKRFKLDLPLSAAEQERFRRFCFNTGRGQGPWTRTLILNAMDAEEAREAEQRQGVRP